MAVAKSYGDNFRHFIAVKFHNPCSKTIKEFCFRLDHQKTFLIVANFSLPEVNRSNGWHDIDASSQLFFHNGSSDFNGFITFSHSYPNNDNILRTNRHSYLLAKRFPQNTQTIFHRCGKERKKYC